MGQRSDLHTLLIDILGSPNVYFQPPPAHQMNYPCIVYRRDYASTSFADNNPFRRVKRYVVTIMDENPDSLIPDKVGALPMCLFDRWFAVGKLNHDVYKLFF